MPSVQQGKGCSGPYLSLNCLIICHLPPPPLLLPEQAAGLVPIVEPEILIDGDHSIGRFREVTERVVSECVAQMWRKVRRSMGARGTAIGHGAVSFPVGRSWLGSGVLERAWKPRRATDAGLHRSCSFVSPSFRPGSQNVVLEGSLLKPQMVIPGADCPSGKASPEDIAHHTVTALRRCVHMLKRLEGLHTQGRSYMHPDA